MKKLDNLLLIGGLLMLVIVGGAFLLEKSTPQALEQEGASQAKVFPAVEGVTLVIDEGGGEPKIFEGRFREGMTAFDLLEEGVESANLPLKTKTYDIGVFVEAIGARENGQEGKYWLYYVNGEIPMVSVDKKEIEQGDKIEFKFEESPF